MEQANGQIMLFHLSGPMSFSSAKALCRRHAAIADYQVMLLDLTEVPSIDFTTARAMEDIINDTINAGRHLLLVGTCDAVRKMLEQQKILKNVDANNIYKKRIDALLHAQRILNGSAAASGNS